MGKKKCVRYGRGCECNKEKILDGLLLTHSDRHNLAVTLSLHVLDVLKAQNIEPFEEEGNFPRKKNDYYAS